ncbi:MAG: hypothetical protein JSV22_07630 [Bacteroidales bacterium]|nr:MAG: hypothetical protein JSV22_07630 [Bacteroidales bacterium]
MCCNSNQNKNICQGYYFNNPVFWSRKKKINLLEERKECLEKQLIETKEAIEELKK